LGDHLFNDLDFKDKSVLDVGCWDGAYSFLAEQRGASRVVSFDRPSCRWGGTGGYEFLHEHFNSKAEFKDGNIYQLPFQSKEFDIVLCYGVLYHMSDPLMALQKLFPVAKTTIAFEGLFSTQLLPSLELRTPIILKNARDSSVIYVPSQSFMEITAGYQGFKLRKVTTLVRRVGRMAMIFDRVSEPIFQFPNKVFPSD
jgi:tRNA (mo5U34)-methyltransferase